MSKFTATPDEDLPQSLKDLKAYVASYAGLNGGDPESPIWFCAREPVGHVENYGRSVNPSKYQYFGSDSYCITPKEAEILVLSPYQGKYGHPGGVGFYRSQIGIATALIENPSDPEQVTSARRAVQLYQFMSKHRLVYSLSLSPIPNRHNAEQKWNQKRLVSVPEARWYESFAEWTGFEYYAETSDPRESFVAWCAKVRSPIFVKLRRKYAPAVIYCGDGADTLKEFCRLWSGKTLRSLAVETESISGLNCSYLWLDNGKRKRPTLLLIGPYFGSRGYLDTYEKYWAVAKAIRELTEKKLGEGALRLDEFVPEQMT